MQHQRKATVNVGPGLLGRVIDPMGQPLDGHGPLQLSDEVLLYGTPLNPLGRALIRAPLRMGIRAIDGLLTCGKGQRIGIFAAAGVGKSTLMGMMACETTATVIVIGLIGEHGREVREFIEHDLGEEGMRRSVVVAATSDQPSLLRLRGAFLAMAIAEYFRDQGEDVLLLMDSLTWVAMAQREVGLSVGEPPTSKGYTPSVFALLPKLLERAGTCAGSGSITGMDTVLVEATTWMSPSPMPPAQFSMGISCCRASSPPATTSQPSMSLTTTWKVIAKNGGREEDKAVRLERWREAPRLGRESGHKGGRITCCRSPGYLRRSPEGWPRFATSFVARKALSTSVDMSPA